MKVVTGLVFTLLLATLWIELISALSFDTSGCGDTKGCFRFPDSCDSSESCDFLVTYNASNSDKVDFELSGSGDWVGVGFSDDQIMPDTDIIICVDPSAQPASGHYYADARRTPPLTTPTPSSVTFLEVVSEDGIVRCKVSRELSPNDANMKDLRGEVFLLGAIGAADGNNLRIHSQREPSPEKVDVAKTTSSSSPGEGSEVDMIILHGSLMTVAWIGFATVGLFTARYMRQVWEPTEIFGKKAWFQVHRTVMTLTVSLTIAGIVVIFVEIKEWSSNAGAHPYIGIIVLALALAQPIMAFFRPHPGEPRRNMFNWVHRLVGSCALVLAVVTIYLGLDLDRVGLGEKGLYAVITFYVGEVIIFLFEVYLIMSTRRRAAKTASSNQIEGIHMEPPNHQPPPEPEMPMKEAMIRTTFFVFALLLGSTVSLTIILLMVLK